MNRNISNNMSNNNKSVTNLVFRGKLQYARVLGDPVLNYNKDGQEWKFDFIPLDTKGSKAELKEVGVADRLRVLTDSEGNERYDGQAYMSFKQNALRKNGEPNYPIKVQDINGNPWPEDRLLGNDTIADVRFVVIDNGQGRFNGVYPRSIRVLELVPYESDEFQPIAKDDPFYKAAQQAENDIAMLKGKQPSAGDTSDISLEDDLTDDISDMVA